MAEILLSLTIIGVVAAITLPSLTGNINERTWNTQRKALYARMSQAVALMPALNGYGTLTEDENHSVTADTAAETFVTEGLAKVLKINNICDSEHLNDCGLPDKITAYNTNIVNLSDIKTLGAYNPKALTGTLQGFVNSFIDTKAAAFETQNGESILVYYNPQCGANDPPATWFYFAQAKVCANFVYDLNGNKGPNTFGKDIGFMSVLYSFDPVVVAPIPLYKSNRENGTPVENSCLGLDSESRLPTKEELSSIFYNNKLLGFGDYIYWSSSRTSSSIYWGIDFRDGDLGLHPVGNQLAIKCVKR